MNTPHLDELSRLAQLLKSLLDSPEPGLITWRAAIVDACTKIGEYGKEKNP